MATERSKKRINFPQTSQIPDERMRIYARKLTSVLEDMLDWINQENNYVYNQMRVATALRINVSDSITVADSATVNVV